MPDSYFYLFSDFVFHFDCIKINRWGCPLKNIPCHLYLRCMYIIKSLLKYISRWNSYKSNMLIPKNKTIRLRISMIRPVPNLTQFKDWIWCTRCSSMLGIFVIICRNIFSAISKKKLRTAILALIFTSQIQRYFYNVLFHTMIKYIKII